MDQNNPDYNQVRDVHIHVEFLKIGEIDIMNEKYTAEVHIQSKWSEYNLDIKKYDPKEHWNPHLYVENILNELKQTVEYSFVKKHDHLVITEDRILKAQFMEKMELNNFPVDMQELNVLVATKLDTKSIHMVTENFSLINREAKRTFVDQQKWEMFKFVEMSHTYQDEIPGFDSSENLDKRFRNIHNLIKNKLNFRSPIVIATCQVARRPGFYIFNAFFLILLFTANSLTVFSIDYKLPANRLQTTYTILVGSISFKWVINRSLPPVSYLTSLDKYAILCIFYVCILGCWHGIIGTCSDYLSAEWSKKLDTVFFSFAAISFLLFHIFGLVRYYIETAPIRRLREQDKNLMKEYIQKLKQQ